MFFLELIFCLETESNIPDHNRDKAKDQLPFAPPVQRRMAVLTLLPKSAALFLTGTDAPYEVASLH